MLRIFVSIFILLALIVAWSVMRGAHVTVVTPPEVVAPVEPMPNIGPTVEVPIAPPPPAPPSVGEPPSVNQPQPEYPEATDEEKDWFEKFNEEWNKNHPPVTPTPHVKRPQPEPNDFRPKDW